MALCGALTAAVLAVGRFHPFSPLVLGCEALLTILSLFLFGSMRYQVNKNALAYGATMVIGASFFTTWWPGSGLNHTMQNEGLVALYDFLCSHLLRFTALDDLIHADTMLFILGLTLFVSVIAQTRILETVSFALLKKNKGRVLPTIAALTALVSVASGVLAGVSMIGLMIRTLVIILFLSKTDDDAVIFAIIVSTVITTVCGMWLAYGEPPNLIMKANLSPLLTNSFFLQYCLPIAVGSYLIVFWNLRRRHTGKSIRIDQLDVLDLHMADVLFMQASRYGSVLTPIEFLEENKCLIGPKLGGVLERIHQGESMGCAFVNENVEKDVRLELLGKFVSADLAPALEEHYSTIPSEKKSQGDNTHKIASALKNVRRIRLRTQIIGALSFVPFIGLLIWHGINQEIPLFMASFSGFAIALTGVFSIEKLRRLALREARQEYGEYLFLFPLFLSVALLQKSGFFDQLSVLLRDGIGRWGSSVVAALQYAGACVLSALLDNNIVADFASRALRGLDVSLIRLFSMAQIAGYAVGGCWTHIGSAQSIIAFAFIRREVDERYTPFQWVRLMTPLILEISVLMVAVIFGRHLLLALFFQN